MPGTTLGIAAGMAVCFLLSLADPGLRTLAGNELLLGPLGASAGGFGRSFVERWGAIGGLGQAHLVGLLGSALALAAWLSIYTLKTSVVLDKLTHSRHDPDRELFAQGMANVTSAVTDGIAGAGTMGATLVGLKSGTQTRAAGMVQGALALVVALLLGAFIAWVPVATLAGILVAVGLLMIDREPLRFARSRSAVLDFMVIATVVLVAVLVGLTTRRRLGCGWPWCSSCANEAEPASCATGWTWLRPRPPGIGQIKRTRPDGGSRLDQGHRAATEPRCRSIGKTSIGLVVHTASGDAVKGLARSRDACA